MKMYLPKTLSVLLGVMPAMQFCTGESLTKNDITLIYMHGVTEGIAEGINIISRNTTTVTFELKQYLRVPIEKIFYEYYYNPFSATCSERTGVKLGEVIELTAYCVTFSHLAFVDVCIQDSTGNVLVPEDKARVPKCCSSDPAEDIPTACYKVAINCEAESNLASTRSAPTKVAAPAKVAKPRTLTYRLPHVPNYGKRFSYGLCVMNAREGVEVLEVKTSKHKLKHTSQGSFQDNTMLWDTSWAGKSKFYHPININGLGNEYCEGGEYLAPNRMNAHRFKRIDFEITAEVDFDDVITVCAMVCTQAEGGWPTLLRNSNYTVSPVWQVRRTGRKNRAYIPTEPSARNFQWMRQEPRGKWRNATFLSSKERYIGTKIRLIRNE